MRNSDESKRVLNESLEHVEEGSTGEPDQAATAGQPAQKSSTPAPSATSTKAKAKPKPVAVEETPEPPRAADAEAAAAKAEVVEDIAEAPPTSPKTDKVFEDMLDSILG